MLTLGQYIREGRAKRKLAVKEVLERAELDATIGVFSHWENDKRVPSDLTLEKICACLGLNEKIAFNLWAQAHIETPRLKKLFLVRNESRDVPKSFGSPIDLSIYPAAETLTVQERDLPYFLEHISAPTIILRCIEASVQHDTGLSVSQAIYDLGVTEKYGNQILRDLVEMNYLTIQNKKYRTRPGIKFLFTPETETFEIFRRARIRFRTNRLLEKITPNAIALGAAYRAALTGDISNEDLPEFVAELRALANRFLGFSKKKTSKTSRQFEFVILLGAENEYGNC